MSLDSRLAVPVVPWLGVGGGLAAQEPHPHQAEALGRVVFPVSCTPEAQTRFERAVALLHSFWYERAADTFREAVVADTACAMGYWGQAMSLFHPLWTPPIGVDLAAGLAASERGLALARTPRERDYLAAIRTYYAAYGERDHEARLAARSEEHTSELQSLAYLVCRLLLEKKKKKTKKNRDNNRVRASTNARN